MLGGPLERSGFPPPAGGFIPPILWSIFAPPFSLDDLGQEGNPTHPDGLRDYIDALRAEGITDDEIDLMAKRNPARLLGLE